MIKLQPMVIQLGIIKQLLEYKWSNTVTYSLPQEAMVQLRSWMIPAEACPGTFVALKGACGKTTTTL